MKIVQTKVALKAYFFKTQMVYTYPYNAYKHTLHITYPHMNKIIKNNKEICIYNIYITYVYITYI